MPANQASDVLQRLQRAEGHLLAYRKHIHLLRAAQKSKDKGSLDKRLMSEYANTLVPKLVGLEGHVARVFRQAQRLVATGKDPKRGEIQKLKEATQRIATEVPALRMDVKHLVEEFNRQLASDPLRTPVPKYAPAAPMNYSEMIDFVVLTAELVFGHLEARARKILG